MNPGLTRKEITDTLAALHKLTTRYRTLPTDNEECPICTVNDYIVADRLEKDNCQYCPHTYLDNVPLSTPGNRVPCIKANNYISLTEIIDFKYSPDPNFQRINRCIHQLVYMLMETPE